ncbi:MAG: LysR family transcriptional regulator [Dechloromonas sp.]|nr:MAG: LysR family transcriptional regulator [Dechloromonas sp.]
MNWLGAWESFVRVVEAGSMAGAARGLKCTRAQVSKQIAELERSFGVRLIERSTRRLVLTPPGEVFLQHARRTLEAIRGTEIAVRNLGEQPCGVLRISASISFGRMYVAPLLPRLTARYPELACELVLTDQSVDLFADNIDIALRMTKAPPEEAVARKLVPLKRVICAAPAYLAAHGEPRTPQELAGHSCFNYLVAGETADWCLADGRGNEIRVPVSSRLRFNNLDCVREAVLAGQGLAIMATYLCAADLAAGRLQAVLGDYEPVTRFGTHVHACYTPSRVRVPKVRVFLDALEREFNPVPPWERPGG